MPFFGTDTDSTAFWYSSGEFFDNRTDSTFSRYWPGFSHFSILTHIRPISDTRRDSFSTLARILSFLGTHPDSPIFRYSHRFDPFSVLVGTVFRHSYGFYLFPVITQIWPFSGTRQDNLLIIAQILPFPGTPPDSTIFQYWHRFDPFLVLAVTVFRHSHRFYLFPVLTQIRPFSGTHWDSFSIIAQILPFPGTLPDSAIFRY